MNLVLRWSNHYTSIFKCAWRELGSTELCHSYYSSGKVCNYTVMYLLPEKTKYCVFWHNIFQSSWSGSWNLVLLLVELIFSLPVSKTKVEQVFSLMKQIKVDERLLENFLSFFIWICMEGPEPEFFDSVPVMTLWNDSVNTRKINQAGNCLYKKHKKARPLTLLDLEESSDGSDSTGENIFSSLE